MFWKKTNEQFLKVRSFALLCARLHESALVVRHLLWRQNPQNPWLINPNHLCVRIFTDELGNEGSSFTVTPFGFLVCRAISWLVKFLSPRTCLGIPGWDSSYLITKPQVYPDRLRWNQCQKPFASLILILLVKRLHGALPFRWDPSRGNANWKT